MNEGTVVLNDHNGHSRYGIIESKRIGEANWAFFKVKWFNDEQYENAIAYRKTLTGTDCGLKEYRSDQLKVIDVHKTISTLKDIRNELNLQGQND